MMMLCRIQIPLIRCPGPAETHIMQQIFTTMSVCALLVSAVAGAQLDVVDTLKRLRPALELERGMPAPERNMPAPEMPAPERNMPAPEMPAPERNMPAPASLERNMPEEDFPNSDALDPVDTEYAQYTPQFVMFLPGMPGESVG